MSTGKEDVVKRVFSCEAAFSVNKRRSDRPDAIRSVRMRCRGHGYCRMEGVPR